MNLSDIEAKVREATNNEPWGASTTLMAQIAAGTYNYREREEILSFIFRRFTEKTANEWRQIYKLLQLLEYLIRNGSERIIDEVRLNSSLIQMLKLFHYIDSKGRDQGVNVRNRLKNLVALLNDDAMIRAERKKARANAKKFGGVAGGAVPGGSFALNSSYGDDDYTGRVFGDGGVYGERYDDPAGEFSNGSTGNDNFEEYDVEDTHRAKPTTGSLRVHAKAEAKPEPKEPKNVDLLGDLVSFDAPKKEDDEDDFDDFQTAPLTAGAQPAATPALSLSSNLASLYVSQPAARTPYSQTQVQTPQAMQFPAAMQTSIGLLNQASSGPAKPKASLDAFSDLFLSAKTKTTPKTRTEPLAATAPAPAPAAAPPAQSGELDLLSL